MHCTPCHIIIGHFQPPPLADHTLYSILAIYTHCILAYLNKIDAGSVTLHSNMLLLQLPVCLSLAKSIFQELAKLRTSCCP